MLQVSKTVIKIGNEKFVENEKFERVKKLATRNDSKVKPISVGH